MKDWSGQTAVYTCITAGYDRHRESVYPDGADYLFFTDGISHPVGTRWNECRLPNLGHLHPRRLSKLPKHCPHLFDALSPYRYVIWIDGEMQITSTTFVEEILGFMQGGMVVSPHFDGRQCGYGEATIRPPKYQREPLDAQVAWYHEDGFPEEFGLYETGVLAWDLHDPRTREVGMLWFMQNLMFSYQDQVSLPYVFWKLGFVPDVLPKSFRDFGWVRINPHARPD